MSLWSLNVFMLQSRPVLGILRGEKGLKLFPVPFPGKDPKDIKLGTMEQQICAHLHKIPYFGKPCPGVTLYTKMFVTICTILKLTLLFFFLQIN